MARKQALQQLSSTEEAALRTFISEESDLRSGLRAAFGEAQDYWLKQTKQAALSGQHVAAVANAARADVYENIEQTIIEFLKG